METNKPERSTYTPLDFAGWRESNSLILTPKFQRRGVWTTPARSYLIDSLLRTMPVPPIYLRVRQSDDQSRIIREVVDGQQRIAAVLDFMDQKYALAKSLDAPYAGKRFGDLAPTEQDAIRQFSFICEIFHGVSDTHVLEVFARLNTYSVKLNAQELRNGRFFGPFKRLAYQLAFEHVEFWRRCRIFSERNIARMLEAELTSELIIVQLAGLQDKKKSIDRFYAEYDETFSGRKRIERRFRETMDFINDSVEDSLPQSEFRRPPLFYTLFCTVYHRTCGVPAVRLTTPKKRLSSGEERYIRHAVVRLSEIVASARAGEVVPSKYQAFVTACLRQTDNIGPRQKRLSTLYRESFK